jgi:hypothetical protein
MELTWGTIVFTMSGEFTAGCSCDWAMTNGTADMSVTRIRVEQGVDRFTGSLPSDVFISFISDNEGRKSAASG